MAKITAQLVKELREKTGAGMMDCKKALTEVDGDLSKAVDYLREKGIAKAAKKSDRIAAEGLTRVGIDNDTAVIFEVNSETDFVAKNEQFISLLNDIEKALLANKPATLEDAMKMDVNGDSLEMYLAKATATIGEKITFRRFDLVTISNGQGFGSYMHMGGKISALVTLEKENAELGKDVAMQVASMAPSFLTRSDVPQEYLDHERKILLETIKNDPSMDGKPEKMITGIVEGRLSKQLKELCLVEQVFFKNPDLKVGELVSQADNKVLKMLRYVTGEGIEKKVDNFAEEVMQQVQGK